MSDQTPPSPNGPNGRTSGGKFAKGNAGGPGNPFGRRVAELRGLLLDAVTGDDLRAIVGMLVEQAKAGDMAAIREVFNRLIGTPAAAPDPDMVEVEAVKLEYHRLEAEARARRAKPSQCDRDIDALLNGDGTRPGFFASGK
jgi:hypothetical protein